MVKYPTLLVICLFSVSSAFAQITITSADMPISGDTLRYCNATPTSGGYDFTLTSANHVWNFTNLNCTSQEVAAYRNASSTPYSFYPAFFGKYGTKIADSIGFSIFKFYNIWDFYGKTSSVFKAEGYGLTYSGFPLAATYTDDDEIYQFPLQYNDRDSSTFRLVLDIPTLGKFIRKGYRINHVDGWGKITTAYGTFNCLRVKSTIFEIDSLLITNPTPINLGFPVSTTEYKWLANGERFPILEVRGNTNMLGFTPTQVRYRYKIPTSSIHEILQQSMPLTLNLYPNPSNQVPHIQDLNYTGKMNLTLTDVSGKVLLQNLIWNSQDAEKVLNNQAASLPQGTYIIILDCINQKYVGRWIKL
ncbi:MAG: T9SS type A sorting domain-containing protein [Bacteroidia bacterium]|nr:T9SS type A sorting domain-containing protein [Bacteroidia bacterium]MDW8347913.1 T9SS type A sorting domain-containing protein [Bacteroidia bacterium]